MGANMGHIHRKQESNMTGTLLSQCVFLRCHKLSPAAMPYLCTRDMLCFEWPVAERCDTLHWLHEWITRGFLNYNAPAHVENAVLLSMNRH